MRLQQAYQRWADSKRDTVAASTWRDYESIWTTHLSQHGRRNVKRLDVRDILSNVSDGRAARVRTVLNMILTEQGVSVSFPTRRRNTAAKRVRSVPTQSDVQKLSELCGDVVTLAAGSGLRWGELIALQADDVDGDTITVDKSYCSVSETIKAPKSQAGYRTVVVLPEALDALSVIPTGTLHHANFMFRVWKPALRKLGLSWRFHDLRHYYATTLIRRGVPIHLVSSMMGHSRTSVTLDIYAGHMDDTLEMVRDKLA